MYRQNVIDNGLIGKLRFLDIGLAPTPDTLQLLDEKGLTKMQVRERMHAITPNGVVVKNTAAFLELWSLLPYWRVLAKVLNLPGATTVSDLVYDLFLKVRQTDRFKSVVIKLGQPAACPIDGKGKP